MRKILDKYSLGEIALYTAPTLMLDAKLIKVEKMSKSII